MFEWLFGSDKSEEKRSKKTFPPEKEEEKNEDPVYLEEDWPNLMALDYGDKVELQLQKNGVENYKGPVKDSFVTYCPPICDMLFFESVEDLRKAATIIWESDVDIAALDVKKGDSRIKNNASEIYEFIEGHDYDIEIV